MMKSKMKLMPLLVSVTLISGCTVLPGSNMSTMGKDVIKQQDADFDLDTSDGSFDADPSMNLLTFRNLVNFCMGFGWTAVLMHEKIQSNALLIIVSVIVGILLVTVVMWIFKWLSGMQQTGNIDVHRSAVGCEGKVYLTIPGERKGDGKVQITINNAVREYDAVTDGETIPTGKAIKVTEVINDYTLLVEELTPTII